MNKAALLFWIGIICSAFGYGQAAGPRQTDTASTAAPSAEVQRAFIDQYCVGCHSDAAKRGNLSLEKSDMTKVGQNAELWEKVVRKLRAGMMPPSGAPRPDPTRNEALIASLESALDRAAPQNL